MATNVATQRVLLRCAMVLGVLLGLSPSVAAMWVMWTLMLKPAISTGGKSLESRDQRELQRQFQNAPSVRVCMFGVAPFGALIIVLGAVKLRRLRDQPPPALPADYGVHRPGPLE